MSSMQWVDSDSLAVGAVVIVAIVLAKIYSDLNGLSQLGGLSVMFLFAGLALCISDLVLRYLYAPVKKTENSEEG